MTRRRVGLIAAAGAGAVLAGVLVWHGATMRSDDSSDDRAASPAPTARSGSPRSTSPDQRLRRSRDGLGIALTADALLSHPAERAGSWSAPRRAGTTSLQVPARSAEGRDAGRLIIVEPDDDGRVGHVAVASRDRSTGGSLNPFQWWTDGSTVELSWPNERSDTWTVRRDDDVLGRSVTGSFVDREAGGTAHRYIAETVRKTRVKKSDGTTVIVKKPIVYLVALPAFDDRAVGGLLPRSATAVAKADPFTSRVMARAAASAPVEAARFLEWNSFIAPARVDGQRPCEAVSHIRAYGGDGRSWSSKPAKDAFNFRGETRSRVSSRVGATFRSDGTNLNAATYDSWMYSAAGTSHAYDGSGRQIAETNVGTKGIRLIGTTSTSSTADRRVKVAVPNPLCRPFGITKAPNIDYTYDFHVDSSGAFSVKAEFDQAPFTELLWEASSNMSDTSDRRGGCIFRFENRGFEYLAGPPLWDRASLDFSFPTLPDESYDCPVRKKEDDK